METKTNVVLVHGAWADGSSWSKVIPLLQKKGLNVVAAQLPLSSIDALDEGESIEGLGKQGPAPAGAAAVRPPDANGLLWIDRDGFAKAFAGDVDPVEASVMAAVQKPWSINSFTGKSGPPAWKHLPSWYMVATNDQMIPPQAEELMAKKMGATVRKAASSHAAMVSHPTEVADLIALAVQSIGKSATASASH